MLVSKAGMVGRGLVLALVGAIVLGGVADAQSDRPTDPAAVVHAFNDAITRGDQQGALAFLDPTCKKAVGPHSLNREEQTCGGGPDQWPSSPPYPHVEEANLRTTGPETAEVDLTLTGGQLPPTPHPIRLHATFTVKNGRITQLLDHVTPETEQELAALPPRGAPAMMPNTGGIDATIGAIALSIVAVLLSGLGLIVRRRLQRN